MSPRQPRRNRCVYRINCAWASCWLHFDCKFICHPRQPRRNRCVYRINCAWASCWLHFDCKFICHPRQPRRNRCVYRINCAWASCWLHFDCKFICRSRQPRRNRCVYRINCAWASCWVHFDCKSHLMCGAAGRKAAVDGAGSICVSKGKKRRWSVRPQRIPHHQKQPSKRRCDLWKRVCMSEKMWFVDTVREQTSSIVLFCIWRVGNITSSQPGACLCMETQWHCL